MNKTLLGLLLAASTMSATAARADWNHGGGRGEPRREAPRGGDRRGHYEPRSVQVWVPGQAQEVWEPGHCRRSWGPPRCAPGHYRTVVSPGHYETRTDWVWVGHGRSREFGLHVSVPGAYVAVGPY